MKVCGVEIEATQIAACEAVLTRPFFDINTVTQAAREAGIAESIRVKDRLGFMRHEALADRVADRIVQRASKAGRIVRKGRGWAPAEK